MKETVGSLKACIFFARRDAHVLGFTPSYCLAYSKGAKVINESETRPLLALFHPLTTRTRVHQRTPLPSARNSQASHIQLRITLVDQLW